MYKAGTITVVHGSTTVVGISTEFIKHVNSGDILKAISGVTTYVVESVTGNLALRLTTPYQGTSLTGTPYVIINDKTPNSSLPLMKPGMPTPSDVLNNALLKIDKHMGDFLDYNSLSAVTYSGENGFYIKGNYRTEELKVGRTIKLLDTSNEIIAYDVVENNTIFEADIVTTPVGNDVTYENETSGEVQLETWDVIHNTGKDSYAFIDEIDTATNILTYSGEIVGSAWSADDSIKCFGKTNSCATISAVTDTTLTIEDEIDDLADFDPAYRLYNFTRSNYRTTLFRDSADLVTAESSDDWAIGDKVYTVTANIKTEMSNLTVDITKVEYGAKTQIVVDSVGASHIDFGIGSDQVYGNIIPTNISMSGETISENLINVNRDTQNHITTGEAHAASAITFADDAQGPFHYDSTDVQDALNEVKAQIGTSGRVMGAVTSVEDEEQFYSSAFIGYDETFFNDGTWWCRFDRGINKGELRLLDSFDNASGEFNFTSGEGFTYEPEVNDVFSLYLTTTSGEASGTEFLRKDGTNADEEINIGAEDLTTTGTIIGGEIHASGDMSASGECVFLFPHGTFLSLEDQPIIDVALAQAITFNDNEDVERLTHSKTVNNSRVTIIESGSYEIIVSGVYSLDGLPANKHMELWIAKNGAYIANSNTRVQLPHVSTEGVLAVAYIMDLVLDDYLELYTWGSDTDCRWLYTEVGTSPTRPAVPSIIMSIKKISGYPS